MEFPSTNKEPFMKSRFARSAAILLFVVVTLMVGHNTMAQGPFNPRGSDPFAQVNHKLDQILAALTPEEPEPPSPGAVTLYTGFVQQTPNNDVIWCLVANVRATRLNVSVVLRNIDGEPLRPTFTYSIDPGKGDRLGYALGGPVLRVLFFRVCE
jgi:hypothetical protein